MCLAEFQVEGFVEPRRAPEKARILGGREPVPDLTGQETHLERRKSHSGHAGARSCKENGADSGGLMIPHGGLVRKCLALESAALASNEWPES